jgi:hypothetical protein
MKGLFDAEVSEHGTVWRPPAPAATARSSDPPTSKDAAKAHDRSGRTASHAALVLTLVRENPGMTYRELHHAQGDRGAMTAEEVMRRLDGLADANSSPALVRRGPQRTCTIRNVKMLTWWPVTEATA